MDFSRWLAAWLKRHPLTDAPEADPARYTAEVMARVRALERRSAPAASPLRWLLWPRLGLALAAAAALLVIVTAGPRSGARLARTLLQDARLLELVDEAALDGSLAEDPDGLAEALADQDLLVLAESPPAEDAWVEETLQLLDQLDEELPEDEAGSSDGWLEDLEMLDESELAASS
jgi:hypothetical protein